VVAHNRPSESSTLEANLGLDAGLVGDSATILTRLAALEAAGVDAVMVKTEPALDEATRFAREVIGPYRAQHGLTTGAAGEEPA
jgi:hypothetical protein